MPELISLADKIKKYRHENHQSQFDFAFDCEISDDCLRMLENMTGNPRLETIQKIAHKMGITVSELLDPNKPLPEVKSEKN